MSRKSLIVNALTFSRVPLILAWLALAVAGEYRGGFWLPFFACAAMLASGLTDLFDGHFARKWKCVSTLGKMADPLMDKVFYVVAFPSLTWLIAHQAAVDPHAGAHALMMLAFTVLYILRDLWVTFMRSVGTMYGADVAAMWMGKVRTALSFPTAGWVYLYLAVHLHPSVSEAFDYWWLVSCYVIEAAMIVLNLVSFVTYTRAYLPYLRRALGS